ncbi:hypothetical protein AZ54_02205 [Xanthomonas oryzae pv. oryzae PXO86]|nr:hypothetical protein AZ54_02205 [Xanthomonas oryzae pv. oryzae PXO86]
MRCASRAHRHSADGGVMLCYCARADPAADVAS